MCEVLEASVTSRVDHATGPGYTRTRDAASRPASTPSFTSPCRRPAGGLRPLPPLQLLRRCPASGFGAATGHAPVRACNARPAAAATPHSGSVGQLGAREPCAQLRLRQL